MHGHCRHRKIHLVRFEHRHRVALRVVIEKVITLEVLLDRLRLPVPIIVDVDLQARARIRAEQHNAIRQVLGWLTNSASVRKNYSGRGERAIAVWQAKPGPARPSTQHTTRPSTQHRLRRRTGL
jgi:hypothetical protein